MKATSEDRPPGPVNAGEPPPRPARQRRPTTAQSIGGVLFGFEQQVWRTAPPPQELVHHARPDAPVPAKDGSLVTFVLPDDLALTPADASDEDGPGEAS